MIIIFLSL